MTQTETLLQECWQVKEQADCLYTREEVHKAVKILAAEITEQLAGANLLVLGVMNGAIIPMGLLLTELDFPLQLDYIHATRYRNKTSGGELKWLVKPRIDISNRQVLLIDDIHDEGITLEEIKNFCHAQGATQVYSAVLVNKKHDRKNNTRADFVALDVPDRYVFGFGMDYKGMLRNVPGIYAVKGL